jgi:hypothetical protein
MEIIHKGPVWICNGCRCMVTGEPNENEIQYNSWFGHPESIDHGYHCPNCKVWNVCKNEIHPYIIERQQKREKREENELQSRMHQEILAAQIVLRNKLDMLNLIKETTSHTVQF